MLIGHIRGALGKVANFLSNPWWAGFGVVVAIAAFLLPPPKWISGPEQPAEIDTVPLREFKTIPDPVLICERNDRGTEVCSRQPIPVELRPGLSASVPPWGVYQRHCSNLSFDQGGRRAYETQLEDDVVRGLYSRYASEAGLPVWERVLIYQWNLGAYRIEKPSEGVFGLTLACKDQRDDCLRLDTGEDFRERKAMQEYTLFVPNEHCLGILTYDIFGVVIQK